MVIGLARQKCVSGSTYGLAWYTFCPGSSDNHLFLCFAPGFIYLYNSGIFWWDPRCKGSWNKCRKKNPSNQPSPSPFTKELHLCDAHPSNLTAAGIRPPTYQTVVIPKDLPYHHHSHFLTFDEHFWDMEDVMDLDLDIDRHDASHSTTPTSGFRTISSVSHYSMASSLFDN